MALKIKLTDGGSFVSLPPKFGADSQTLYVAWKNSIISYNSKTAKRLKVYKGFNDSIADFSIHFCKNSEVISVCSTIGKIIQWKINMGVKSLIQNVPIINSTIKFFKFFYEADGRSRFLLSWLEHDKVYFGILNTDIKELQKINIILKNKDKCSLTFCNTVRVPYIVITQSNNLYFVSLANHTEIYKHSVDFRKYFTCVACHPFKECVITGDSNGQIILWHNLKRERPTREMFHWHTLPVRCLTFSMSGSEFYSGADECVLIKWHVDNPHNKFYLPRLPSGIKQLAVSNENRYIAVATGDNAVQILNSSMNRVSTIQHLSLGSTFSGGMVFDHRTKSLVLNGKTGCVQFYSPYDMNLLYNFEVVGQNRLTNEQNRKLENTKVTKFAVDSQGIWLATVEERLDEMYNLELKLKFWEFNTVKQMFQLNTFVVLPHRKSITEILFQPTDTEDLLCVTVGKDKQFRIWELQNTNTIYNRQAKVWNCNHVGFYKNLSCQGLSFASDGTLIGIGFGPILTMWLSDSCELKSTLSHPNNKETVTNVKFGINTQCHLVVTVTDNHLSVWNLLSVHMVWTIQMRTSLLVLNLLSSHIAVFTKDKQLHIFYPEKSTPIFTENLNEAVVASAFVSNSISSDTKTEWYQLSQLFFITTKQELYCLDTNSEETDLVNKFTDSFSTSLFSNLQPIKRSGDKQQPKSVIHLTELSTQNQRLTKSIDSPAHTMIPVNLVCESLLRTYIKERNVSKNGM